MAVLPIRGVDLAVTDSGAGPTLLWGHGFCSSRRDDLILDFDLLATRHRVVRWDARGHGESGGTPEPDSYQWDGLGRDLVALADVLGIGRFTAGGVSMGAASALHAAIQQPDRITALVLVLPPTAFGTRAPQADEYRSGADLVEEEGVGAYVARVNSRPLVPEILSQFADAHRFVPSVPDHLLPPALRGAGESDLPSHDELRGIAVPALILAWPGDPGHPQSTAERLAELIPQAELSVATSFDDVMGWTKRVDRFLGP